MPNQLPNKEIVSVNGNNIPLEDILRSESLMRDIIIELSKGSELPIQLAKQ